MSWEGKGRKCWFGRHEAETFFLVLSCKWKASGEKRHLKTLTMVMVSTQIWHLCLILTLCSSKITKSLSFPSPRHHLKSSMTVSCTPPLLQHWRWMWNASPLPFLPEWFFLSPANQGHSSYMGKNGISMSANFIKSHCHHSPPHPIKTLH